MDDLNDKSFLLKNENDDGTIEVEVVPEVKDNKGNLVVNQRLTDIKMELDSIDDDLEKLSCEADSIDYAIAAACGAIAGVLDILFVGAMPVGNTTAGINAKNCDKVVLNLAKKDGFSGNNLKDAVGFLNNKYGTTTASISSHPSLFGLVMSIITSISGLALSPALVWVKSVKPSVGIFDGIFNGVKNWGLGVSMTGTKISSGSLPSSITNLLNSNSLNVKPNKLGKMNAIVDKSITNNSGSLNLTNELNVLANLGKQALVVGINEVLVRSFYFLRRLFMEIKANEVRSLSDLKYIDWHATIPFKNRTIVRMVTIAQTVMTAIDITDAILEGAAKSGGNAGAFFGQFFLRINYVGIARCALAVTTDIRMGVKLNDRRNERINLMSEYVTLTNSKIFYKQQDMWKSAEKLENVINENIQMANETTEVLKDSLEETKTNLESISGDLNKADSKNPGLKKDIKDILN